MVTGTDEHGEKIAAAAAARGLSPQEHCDSVAVEFQQLWEKVSLQGAFTAPYSKQRSCIAFIHMREEQPYTMVACSRS